MCIKEVFRAMYCFLLGLPLLISSIPSLLILSLSPAFGLWVKETKSYWFKSSGHAYVLSRRRVFFSVDHFCLLAGAIELRLTDMFFWDGRLIIGFIHVDTSIYRTVHCYRIDAFMFHCLPCMCILCFFCIYPSTVSIPAAPDCSLSRRWACTCPTGPVSSSRSSASSIRILSLAWRSRQTWLAGRSLYPEPQLNGRFTIIGPTHACSPSHYYSHTNGGVAP
ncbi:hypothetical protein P280DRAFT_79962 [Massarina eburnea CBS 473.64]|uniref:Uncharacterized protein n=1 Tax=Massarina eburnea CBS 473.64 TaxID=1395130 RepID=A0A6A6RT27_9PLEO|nr:hypothetical protein P280DRAFT_79962 [Massarina eburnea CBS 473.64]